MPPRPQVGFITFTEVTPEGDHAAYNAWHQLDHMPEQFAIPGVVFGQRWVSTPACRAQQLPVDRPLAAFHYVTLYLMSDPLDETLAEFATLRDRLTAVDRFYEHRRTALSGAWRLKQVASAPHALVAAEVVPFRPNRGIFTIVEEPADEASRGSTGDDLSAFLALPGVAGVWQFESRLWAFGADPESVRPTPEDRACITVVFLDEEPTRVSAALAPLVRARWADKSVVPRFAGPCATITPWEWDWFDDEARSEL